MSLKQYLATSLTAVFVATTAVAVGTVAAAPSANAATLCRSYVYESGGSGSCVADIQKIVSLQLKVWWNLPDGSHGGLPSAPPAVVWDGVFGPKTKAAVQELQRWNRLTADGIVGPKSWAAFCNYASTNVRSEGVNQAEVNAYNAASNAACGPGVGYMKY